MSSTTAHPRPRTGVLRRTAAVGGALLLAVATSTTTVLALGLSPAAAHASLTSSNPEDGAALPTAPEEVSLTFSEDVSSPAFVAVTTPDGTDLAEGRPQLDGPDVVQPLAAPEEPGTYTLAYRVVSADGHPIEGELTFDVRRVAEPSPTPEPTEQPSAGAGSGTDGTGDDAAPEPAETEVAPASQTTDDGFWAQYGVVTLVAVAAAVLVAGLLLFSRRRAQSER